MTSNKFEGRWIWVNDKVENDTYADFIDVILYEKGECKLKISADSDYAIYINGTYVYSGQYADFPWYKVYDEIDVTPYLKEGKNLFCFSVWFEGACNFNRYYYKPGLIYDILLDGKVVASSSSETKCRFNPHYIQGKCKMITSQLGYSFTYNGDYEKEGYVDSVEVKDLPSNFFLRGPKRLDLQLVKYGTHIGDNIYDMGREMVGYPIIKVKIPKDTTITVSFGERLKDGKVLRYIMGRDFSFEIIGNGNVIEFMNPFRKLGLRYFEVEGECEIIQIGLCPTMYPFNIKNVKISNPLRQKIYDTSVRTLRLNAMEHYFDCPWREQGFYALDSRLQMLYGYKAFEGYEYQKWALKLMSEDRREDGLLSIVAPTSFKLVIPSFCLFYIIEMEEYATASGDYSLIDDYLYKLQGILSVFLANTEDGLCKCLKGDEYWNFYEWSDGLYGTNQDKYDAPLNFTVLMALNSMMKICDYLKEGRLKEEYLNAYKQIKEAINKTFFDEEKGLYKSYISTPHYSELVNAYAVITGVASDEIAKNICETLSRDNDLVKATLSMLFFKYTALMIGGEEYKEYILKDIDDKYGYMLSCGATSFWETIKGGEDFDEAGSLCHGWSALPVYFYSLLL